MNNCSSSSSELSSRLESLLGLATALPFEAPSSWLTRAALSQGATTGELADYFGWRLVPDFDVTFARLRMSPEDDVSALRSLSTARIVLRNLFKTGCSLGRFLLYSAGRARYRFCPICLRTTLVPAVPIHWRFAAFRYCPLHHCLLEDDCPNCGALVTLPESLITAGTEGEGVGDLSRCLKCEARLYLRPPLRLAHQLFANESGWESAMLQNGRAVLSALYFGRLEGAGFRGGIRLLRQLDRAGLIPNSSRVLAAAELRKAPGAFGSMLEPS